MAAAGKRNFRRRGRDASRIHERDEAPEEWPQKGAKIIRPAGGNRPSAYRRRESSIALRFFAPFCGKNFGDRSATHAIRRFAFNHLSY